ncbi:hypothetical protein HY497_02245 [Candidatus Woesearchaeota archaeon]|nr:hypothetical protein [Candidatus Woesearchaeota archaeon]
MIEISGDLRIRRKIRSDVFELEGEFPPEAWERNTGNTAGLHTRSSIAQLGMHLNPVDEPTYNMERESVIWYCRPEHLGRHLHGFNPAQPRTPHGRGLRFDIGDRVANMYFVNGASLSRGELDASLERGTIDFSVRGRDFDIDDEGRVYLTVGRYMFGLNGNTPASVRDLESRGAHLIAYEGHLFFLPRRATITRTTGAIRMGSDLGLLLEREVVGTDALEHMRSQYARPDTNHSLILEITNRSDEMLRPERLSVIGRVHHVRDYDTSATDHSTGRNGDGYLVVKQ